MPLNCGAGEDSESPWTARRSNQSVLKEINLEYSLGRVMLRLKLWSKLILWLPNKKSQLIGKDPDAGKDWGQEEKGATEHEIVGWHQCISGQGFEKTLLDSEGQGSPACCSSWGLKEQTQQLNNSKEKYGIFDWFLVAWLLKPFPVFGIISILRGRIQDHWWIGIRRGSYIRPQRQQWPFFCEQCSEILAFSGGIVGSVVSMQGQL